MSDTISPKGKPAARLCLIRPLHPRKGDSTLKSTACLPTTPDMLLRGALRAARGLPGLNDTMEQSWMGRFLTSPEGNQLRLVRVAGPWCPVPLNHPGYFSLKVEFASDSLTQAIKMVGTCYKPEAQGTFEVVDVPVQLDSRVPFQQQMLDALQAVAKRYRTLASPTRQSLRMPEKVVGLGNLTNFERLHAENLAVDKGTVRFLQAGYKSYGALFDRYGYGLYDGMQLAEFFRIARTVNRRELLRNEMGAGVPDTVSGQLTSVQALDFRRLTEMSLSFPFECSELSAKPVQKAFIPKPATILSLRPHLSL